MESLQVVYSADDKYGKYLGISMLSLFQTNRKWVRITVYILDCGMGEDTKEILSGIGHDYDSKVIFIPMKDSIANLNLNLGARKISIASYARLFLASVLPKECNKVLYLDCDTIVCGKLNELWKTSLKAYYVAGVRDTVDSYFLKKIGLSKNDLYINAGVLLVNLRLWREDGLEKKFINFIKEYDGNVPHHDQGTINAICKKKKLVLPLSYNVTSNMYSFSSKATKGMYSMKSFYYQEELERSKIRPIVLHYTTGLVGRPWEENCTHPMKDKYVNVAELSPWKNEKLLIDSRNRSVRIFGFIYLYTPKWFSISIYRMLSGLSHLRDRS